jgi:uncharacterized lipoprotein YbaY/heat shock protein HslJ
MLGAALAGRALGAALLMAALAGGAGAQSASVTGEALYRERLALPPTAVFEAVLEAVDETEAPAAVLGRAEIAPAGQVPIAFAIPYDPARIAPAGRYQVRGRILVDGRPWFQSAAASPVLTGGHGDRAMLILQQVVEATPSTTPAEATPEPAPTTPATDAGSPLGALPASFAGDLPCADCPGIRYQLDLLPDQTYVLRTAYLERGPEHQFDDLGRFTLAEDGRKLVLQGSREPPLQLAVLGPDRLRKLDLAGQEIASGLNYDLVRVAAAAALEPRLMLRGQYRYQADAGRFTECLTGRDLPVAQEGDNRALERAYGEARGTPGAPLLANLEGQIALRPKVEGDGTEPTLVVERFIGIEPAAACAAAEPAPLANSYWKLIELQGAPVPVAEQQREAHLVLRAEDGRFAGSTGCNRLLGRYELAGERLTFSPGATTKMACSAPVMALEAAFVDALGAVASWRVDGEQLELLDSGGQRLARLERRLMP